MNFPSTDAAPVWPVWLVWPVCRRKPTDVVCVAMQRRCPEIPEDEAGAKLARQRVEEVSRAVEWTVMGKEKKVADGVGESGGDGGE